MIQAEFYVQDGGQITGFSVSGHAMFAESGEDIVCAAVSSAAYMTANTITEILSIEQQLLLDEGCMCVLLREPGEIDRAQDILQGFRLHVTQLATDYPNHIAVNLRGVNNA